MNFNWSVFKKVEVPTTIGSVLDVDLPLLGIEGLSAKVDTGAFSGALHATRINEVTDNSGQKHLRFSPLSSPDHVLETDNYHKRKVKSSNGQITIRYAIDTDIVIADRRYPITITLTNRSTMKHPMLIGRKFLLTHGFLVDVSRNRK